MAMPAQPNTPNAPAFVACPHCGGQCTPSARFCGHCRQAIQQPPPPPATGGAAAPAQQPPQGGRVAPTQAADAAPQQGQAPTNWAGVMKTGVLVVGGLIALFIVGNAFMPLLNTRMPAAPDDWSDAGIANPHNSDAGAGGSHPDAVVVNPVGGPLVQGPLIVNNNGVPTPSVQPANCGGCVPHPWEIRYRRTGDPERDRRAAEDVALIADRLQRGFPVEPVRRVRLK